MIGPMGALLRGAAAVALLSALDPWVPTVTVGAQVPAAPGLPAAPHMPVACRGKALPLGGGCVVLPASGADRAARERKLGAMGPGAVTPRFGTEAGMVKRLPERPEAWRDYQLPVDPVHDVVAAGGGDTGEGTGFEIATDGDAPVTLVELEGQTGEAEVVLVGELRGVTVVTRHRVEAPGGERRYLVIQGHLERPGPKVTTGARLGPMAVVGFVPTDEPRLYLEVRLEHEERTPATLSELERDPSNVPVDPRNVLPVRR
jgi:hypothetical protein